MQQGGEGVKNSENFADVLYEWSLTGLGALGLVLGVCANKAEPKIRIADSLIFLTELYVIITGIPNLTSFRSGAVSQFYHQGDALASCMLA